ncbi:MAG: membrane biogenesis protein [Clostridia bacterium]|nr:membrane biogenesis protein [Clostridia bacterium]
MKNDVGKTSPGRAEGRQPCIKRQIPRRIIFHAERRNIRVKEQIARAFHADKPILAMLHLGGYNPNEVHDRAKREIEQLYENGVDAILAEDYFGSPDDVEWALDYLSANWPERVYGLNLLSDPEKGFRLAMRYGAAFMQIDSVCGHLRPGVHMKGDGIPNLYAKTCDGDFADRLAELRAAYPVFLLGGVRFKYQPVRSGRSVEEDLALGRERCDAVVVTGEGTGMNTGIEKIRRFRQALGDFPLFVGAGVTAATCREQLSIADGAIVGSWFKQEGKTEAPVDAERVRQFMKIVQEARCMEK